MPRRRKEPPPESDVDQIVDEPDADADDQQAEAEDTEMAVDGPPDVDDVTEDKDADGQEEEDVRVFPSLVT